MKPDQNPLSNEESVRSGGYPEWKHWRVIKRQTASMPLVIVRHLSRKGEFELAKRWAKIHQVPDPIHLVSANLNPTLARNVEFESESKLKVN